MSQKKDGPRHGTTIGRYLPGMTSDNNTIERYFDRPKEEKTEQERLATQKKQTEKTR